ASLEITLKGKTEKLTAEQMMSNGESNPLPITLVNNDKYTFYLTSISVKNESSIGLAVTDKSIPAPVQPAETFILTASIKPFINLVWGGTMVMVIGFFLSMVFRYRVSK